MASFPTLHHPQSLGGMEPDAGSSFNGTGSFGDDSPAPQALNPSQVSSSRYSMDDPSQQGQSDDDLAEKAAVKRWLGRVKQGKLRFDPDFRRMRQNMEFAAGLQWDGQKTMRDPDGRYVCNVTLEGLTQLVSQLYARNPQVEVTRQQRRNFQLWDGKVESLMEMFQRSQQGRMMGMPDMEAEATLTDFKQGRMMEQITDNIADTLQKTLAYQMKSHKPDFKEQMKQLVVRVLTCGVGYCIPSLVRENVDELGTTVLPNTAIDRMKLIHGIMEKMMGGDMQEDDPEVETLKALAMSLGVSVQTGEYELDERIEYDFPPATSIIPDPNCRSLKEWVGARWVSQEFILPIEEINSWFGLDGDQKMEADPGGMSQLDNEKPIVENAEFDPIVDIANKPKGRLYRIFDAMTKTHLFVAEGYDYYLQPPEPMEPGIKGFWPVFSLVFNAIEVETNDPEMTVSIFPPSVVDLLRDPQREWNRTRDALRGQRNANAPTYLVRKGVLTEQDISKIENREPNEVVELEGVPADKEPAQIIQVLQVAGIDPQVYDTRPLEQDMMLGAGLQQANIGPAQPDVTATVGTIAENSRLSVSSSKVDDLDGFLSRLMQGSGEMAMQGFSTQTVQRIVGVGAVWPTMDRADYLSMIDITIKAASSGRPNQAIKAQVAMQLTPLLMQLGSPPPAILEYLVPILDDQLDPQRFFPIPGQSAMGQPGQTSPSQPSPRQNQPPQSPPSNQPAPIPRRPLASGTIPPSPVGIGPGVGPGVRPVIRGNTM